MCLSKFYLCNVGFSDSPISDGDMYGNYELIISYGDMYGNYELIISDEDTCGNYELIT